MGDLTEYTGWKYGGPVNPNWIPADRLAYGYQPEIKGELALKQALPDTSGDPSYQMMAEAVAKRYGLDLYEIKPNGKPRWKDPSDPGWANAYKNSDTPVLSLPKQAEWAQKYPGTSWQSRLWDQKHAPQLVPQGGQAPTTPMQGNSGAGWGAPIPQGPTDFSQDASYYRNAPGYRPGMGSMTPEAQAAADRAFEARQRAFDLQEQKRNRAEDWSLAQARRQDIGQANEWQKYQALMAQDDPNAANWNPTATSVVPQMGTWDYLRELLANQRPNQGLR